MTGEEGATRLEHSLQAATRAHRAGEDEETGVCVLLHDVGDILAPINQSQAAAAVLRPYGSDQNHWIVLHHDWERLEFFEPMVRPVPAIVAGEAPI